MIWLHFPLSHPLHGFEDAYKNCNISRKILKVGNRKRNMCSKKVNFLRDTFGEYTLHILFFRHNITSLDQVCTDNSSSRGPLLPQTSSPNFENGYFFGQKIIKKSTFSKFGNFIPGTFQTLNLRVGLFLGVPCTCLKPLWPLGSEGPKIAFWAFCTSTPIA